MRETMQTTRDVSLILAIVLLVLLYLLLRFQLLRKYAIAHPPDKTSLAAITVLHARSPRVVAATLRERDYSNKVSRLPWLSVQESNLPRALASASCVAVTLIL